MPNMTMSIFEENGKHSNISSNPLSDLSVSAEEQLCVKTEEFNMDSLSFQVSIPLRVKQTYIDFSRLGMPIGYWW
jgi:hypothetical protein